jgi:hypothetical protein
MWRRWLDSSRLGSGPVAGSCENGNDSLGSRKGGEFFLPADNYHLHKEGASELKTLYIFMNLLGT